MDSNIVFSDVIGPVMIGPSSSHTAGACRIGNMAASIYGQEVKEIEIDFHGSFAETYQGHGTDRALVGGLMGFATDDPRIIEALDIAEEKGISIHYQRKDLGPVHPNTARVNFLEEGKIVCSVTGSSIGGGQVRIIDIDGIDTYLDGKFWTLLMTYQDRKKMIYDLTARVANYELNIANMSVRRKDQHVTLICDFDDGLSKDLQEELRQIQGIENFRIIPKIID